MHYPKVSVILVNWNGKNDTIECLESVHKIDYPQYEVIVVDNGSRDNSVSVVRERFPEVTIIETGRNLGFSGGNNAGIRRALQDGAECILLLNNDTIVDSQIINGFLNAMQDLPKEGILAAKIYYYSEPNRVWYAGAKWIKESAHFVHVGQGCFDTGSEFNAIMETDYACGCALFVNSELFKKIGLFDEKFFLTFEETDLCYRARKAGYRSYFIPDAKVWHKVSTSSGGENSALFHYFLTRNRLLWAEKNLPFNSRLVLYMHVLHELLKSILPPRFHLNKSGEKLSLQRIYGIYVDYKISFKRKFGNPITKARLVALRDYAMRRFGNCPELVRSLGK